MESDDSDFNPDAASGSEEEEEESQHVSLYTYIHDIILFALLRDLSYIFIHL